MIGDAIECGVGEVIDDAGPRGDERVDDVAPMNPVPPVTQTTDRPA